MQYFKPKHISLKASNEFNEKWIQDRISDEPGILGLSELSLARRMSEIGHKWSSRKQNTSLVQGF